METSGQVLIPAAVLPGKGRPLPFGQALCAV
jgi:hypothetical protein